MIRPLGLIPDRPASRDRDKSERNYSALPVLTSQPRISNDIIQPIAWIRSQLAPSCVGQFGAAGIDGARMVAPWASAVSAWREARRRQGRIEQIDEGTRLEYLFDGLEGRGWDPYRDGEETDTEEAGLGAPDAGDDLGDELFAHDKRSRGLTRYRIFGTSALDQIDEALTRPGFMVGLGIGTRTPFYDLGADVIATGAHLGGGSNGHAMRIFARIYRNGRRLYGFQNSWGSAWGGCRLPSGGAQPGCCWADESVIASAWEIYAAEVKQ